MTLARRTPARFFCKFAAAAIVLFGFDTTEASYISSPWEDYVLRADFVGIVECTTAGGIVAKYEVIESWKGAPVGTEITIRSETSYTGDHFPITLAGEKYLVIARRDRHALLGERPSSRGPEPLWWRQIPYEYELLAPPTGRVLLPVDEEQGLWELGSEHQDVGSFRWAASILINLSPDQQEAYFLREASATDFWNRQGHLVPNPPKDLSAQAEVQKLLRQARNGSEEDRDRVVGTLSYAGGPVALRILEGMGLKESPFCAEDHASIIRWIRQNVGEKGEITAASDSSNGVGELHPPEDALRQARTTLAGVAADKERHYDAPDAMDLLTVHDPGSVVSFLMNWRAPARSLDSAQAGYLLGSYFGFRCGVDRVEHLKTLLGADDPTIRVAAAVYLALEDEELGLPALRGLLALPDDAGAWAAVSLISHRDRSPIPRALELLRVPQARGRESDFHENLRGRLFVLLSNIAAASRVAPPPSPRKLLGAESRGYDQGVVEGAARDLYQEYLQWFDLYHDRLVAQDPWFQELRKQRVD